MENKYSKLKVYGTLKKNNKLSKTHKVIRVVTALSLTVALAIGGTACVSQNFSTYSTYHEKYGNTPAIETPYITPESPALITTKPTPTLSTTSDSYIEEISKLYNPTLGVSTIDLSNFPAALDFTNYQMFKKYIEDIRVTYPYEELYGIDAALAKYNQVNFSVSSHGNTTFGNTAEISPSQLVQVVLENNKKYLADENNRKGGMFYKELSLDEINKICQLICEVFNDYVKNQKIDVPRVKCFLGDLKIFKDSSLSNAYISTDNCMIINPISLNILQTLNTVINIPGNTEKDEIDAFRNTIEHEIMHTFQFACNDMRAANTYEINFGLCYSWKDLPVNPLMSNWFADASAEMEVMNYTGDEALAYPQAVGYLQSMSLSTILKDGVKVNQTEDLSFSNKLDPLFQQFGCQTYEDKKEVIKLLYSTGIMQSENEDFFKAYENTYGKTLTPEEKEALRFKIKESVCLTLTKQFYLNLADQIYNKKIGMQDVFFLLTAFEDDLNSHLKYTNMDIFPFGKEFLSRYIEIQDEFFEVLSKSNNYDIQELIDFYNTYGMTINLNGIESPNYNLNWLSSEKKDYLLKRVNDLKSYSTSNIRTSNELMLDLSKQNAK